ncbi:MBL fold metallo-hydrolase [Pararhodobacter sp.]|uniref:MBL fold metallo-hydrolase n=1 Tax=Pararhodobacter sp. TaxID=2127056 RepID=UPI002AFEDF57|nr:MBL fold metallo-hydrolase [Pararhodobacter sp.]
MAEPVFPRLTFHGAARAVTGSCHRLETASGTILIDCGMFQGSKTEKELNYRPFPFKPSAIDAVLLTHAHIDHSGLLPKLVHDGFDGVIHATAATADLAGVMLPDSAHIQAMEVRHLNRRRARWQDQDITPIYDDNDVKRCLNQMRGHGYGDWFTVLPGVQARLWNAGHMLGSASVELEVMIPGHHTPMRVLFSGDIGPAYKLLHPDPEGPSGVDYLICESTYGGTDRPSASVDMRRLLLRDEVKAAMRPDGVLLIPSFAVERAQELISDLTRLMADGDLPEIPIYVDSPMASRATEVFHRHSRSLENGPAFDRALHAPQLNFTHDVEDSKALDYVTGFHIIIAASGMCEAGRIRHRLKRWLWQDAATVLFVGYQANGTLGRILQDGARIVRIQGDTYDVRARLRSIDLYSGHADGPELDAWIAARGPISGALFLTHGEEPPMEALAARIAPRLAETPVLRPVLDEGFDLTPAGPRANTQAAEPRIRPEQVGRLDWHNDVSKLFLDLNESLSTTTDEKSRNVLIRAVRRALDDWSETHGG